MSDEVSMDEISMAIDKISGSVGDLQAENARLRKELKEALEKAVVYDVEAENCARDALEAEHRLLGMRAAMSAIFAEHCGVKDCRARTSQVNLSYCNFHEIAREALDQKVGAPLTAPATPTEGSE